MSGEVQLLVDAIDKLGNANNRTIASVIINLIYTLVTIGLLVVGWNTIKLTQTIASSSQSLSMDLKKQDLQQRVLREDIFVTVIPVYSSDGFNKLKHKQASGNSGLLKIMKHSNDMWEYLIIDPVHYINGDTGDIIASSER